jgi:hypothetical protein
MSSFEGVGFDAHNRQHQKEFSSWGMHLDVNGSRHSPENQRQKITSNSPSLPNFQMQIQPFIPHHLHIHSE